jgi:hypothetical protein
LKSIEDVKTGCGKRLSTRFRRPLQYFSAGPEMYHEDPGQVRQPKDDHKS